MQNTSGAADTDVELNLDVLIPDLPSGPLDEYRRRASFNWKLMKLTLEGEEVIKFKNKVWRTLEQDPLFHRNPSEELSRDEYRKLSLLRLKRLMEYDFLPDDEFLENPLLIMILYTAIGLYDWSLAIKKFLAYEFFTLSLRATGSTRHMSVMDELMDFNALGCIALTEMAHGSNTKGIMTTATFDSRTNEFILNTPSPEAAKVWSGNLGQTATHAVVFAQFYGEDGKCHGLNVFLVPVRDPKTLLPYPSITVGDMGPKIGLNGLDNGFLIFNNYRVHKDFIMNRIGDVDGDGKFVNQLDCPKKRMGITMGVLSMGRVGIIGMAVSNMKKALTIAIRYSASRRQFGPVGKPEQPVIEYQMQQWRLIPYLAACYLLDNFSLSFHRDFINFEISVLFGNQNLELSEQGQEIHALSSAGKAFAGWIARDTIQECREACGGHGYLKASALGDLRNDHDANNTYEGDNNVLQQQTSNYLLRLWQRKVEDGKPFASQLGSVDFLDHMEEQLQYSLYIESPKECLSMEFILDSYKFLVCYLMRETAIKLKNELESGKDLFTAKCDSQIYFARSLSLAFIEYVMIQRWDNFIRSDVYDQSLCAVFYKLGLLYGLWALEKHLSILYQAGYCRGPQPATCIKHSVLQLCKELKDECVSLVDVIAPPDFILNSSLGKADGNIYHNIFESILKSKGATERPSWWEEFTLNKPLYASIKPKL
ncbi:Peroxisomal acyl-coenzyme A oxidase 3-like protein [Dinothrombium tinctorium]|uniref:Acyl-coenzyme A oxidase n=1 Tax=Dinothrombium tinctorium TaxID=1965070 RepID=A0A3S3Q684_9ACAR|nr:Peroxisomal acyl-coenzyme A oxidase 3-like protein [Dinothrombium tinctorium]